MKCRCQDAKGCVALHCEGGAGVILRVVALSGAFYDSRFVALVSRGPSAFLSCLPRSVAWVPSEECDGDFVRRQMKLDNRCSVLLIVGTVGAQYFPKDGAGL